MSVGAWRPGSEVVQYDILASASQDTILLLPEKFDNDRLALYSDTNAGLIKTARAIGISVEFGYDSDHRRYLSEYSAGKVVAEIVLGIGTNLTTDLIKHIYNVVRIRVLAALGGSSNEQVDSAITNLKIARLEINSDGVVAEGIECIGPVGGIETTLRSIIDQPNQKGLGHALPSPGGDSEETGDSNVG
jgi:hypothetical protein